MPRKKPVRRKKVAPGSAGLGATETKVAAGPELRQLSESVEADGGAVLASYREPVGGKPLLLVALPVERVQPTPYQRDASETHVKRLMGVVEKLGCYLDPIIAIREEGAYWTPNGNHRLQALKKLGVKSVIALLIPETALAFQILALNTEKAHNLREKSLEVIRMARALAQKSSKKETEYAFEFEEACLLTLGFCYEKRPRFGGGAYQPVLRRIDDFIDFPIAKAFPEREKRAESLLELDEAVASVVEKLKERGLTSPYLRPYVVARINPTRFSKAASFDFEEVVGKMIAAARRFNVDKVRQEDLARVGGPPVPEE
ncbi:MAG TPA: ParB N-terminal domain-containing protein [Acidobacteriota bacterium]|nr:ParB N-terminal domain-containing protein [Acidobacteriota bacterium]